MPDLILASNSPRRREILGELVSKDGFRIVPSGVREQSEGTLSPRDIALKNAEAKAEDVFARYPHAAVLGADTVVALEGRVFGKPASPDTARAMLRALSGKVHSVFTGVCLLKEGLRLSDVCETKVKFYTLSEELIERYIASGLPFDKAGAYGIQDGFPLVESYEGSYTNVVGLPRELAGEYLRKANLC